MSNRVSVAEGQKPKPKPAFKFLRRDEGRLSYSAQPEAPVDTSASTDNAERPRRDSKSLREAIARDMRTAKSHDPLGEVVVAMPKRAPPPSGAGASTGAKPPVKRQPPSKTPATKPGWVDPEVPDHHHDEVPDEVPSRGYVSSNSKPRARESVHAVENDSAPQEAAPYTAERQYEGGTPRVRGVGAAPPAARRYVDPEANYREEDVPVERNYFRPQARAQNDYNSGSAVAGAGPAAGRSRGKEEEELMVQLEDEIRAAQEERARYMRSKQQLDRERKRFEDYKYTSEQQLEDERAELESLRRTDQREAQRGVKSLEERYKSVSGLLATERDANRKLSDENDSLRAQLEELTGTLREAQRANKAETTRLRRDLESLQKRNSELLAMTKESQTASAAPRLGAQPRDASHPVLKQPPQRQGSTGSAAHEAKPSSSGSGPVPPLDFVEERTTSPRKGSHPHTQVVLDFSPRAKDEDAAERRAREMEERMRREEEEMQRRRQQREQEAEERRKREEEETAAAAAAMEAERVRVIKEKREALRKKKEELRKDEEELDAEREREKEKDVHQVAKEQLSKERKASGHPATTPRNAAAAAAPSNTGGAAAKKRSPSRSKESSSSSAPKRHIPTKKELLGDNEEIPAEEFPKDTIVSQTPAGESTNKREVLYRSGKREVHYANGTVKVVLPSGHTILHFTNGDVKRTYPSGKSTYWYDAAQTVHTQLPSGVQLFEFNATGQTERHLPDGTKEILYPDGIFKIVKADGLDETIFPEEK